MLENRYGTFVGMPCGLFKRDMGAKNARKIVFIASTRKSLFGTEAFAILSIKYSKWPRAAAVCYFIGSRFLRVLARSNAQARQSQYGGRHRRIGSVRTGGAGVIGNRPFGAIFSRAP